MRAWRHARGAVRALIVALPALAWSVAPAAAADAPDAELEALRDRIVKALPEVKRDNVQRSAAPGLFEVRVGHAFGYVTPDGRYLVSGDLLDLETGLEITEARRREERLRTVAALQESAIVFAPPEPLVRQWVTIFTDIDCEYCSLLHREVPELNQRGIGVRYLFFSKYGAPSEAYTKAQKVWCDKDKVAALQDGLLSGKVKDKAKLCRNPVVDQYLAARGMGLKGTPVAILPSGKVFYGYVKADRLAAAIDEPPTTSEVEQGPVDAAP